MNIKTVSMTAAFFLCACTIALAAERTAIIESLSGPVEVKQGESWGTAQESMVLKQGDTIRTGSDASATIRVNGLAEGSQVDLKENTELKLAELLQADDASSVKTLLDVSLGSILITAEKLSSTKSKFEVKTPTSIVGVRGTTFAVTVEAIDAEQ